MKKSIKVYDPFFCAGTVVRHLNSLGIDDVINVCEDFWARVESRVDWHPHDVLVTNPPFSGDHISRLLETLRQRQGTPYFLLIPRWVSQKPYWFELLKSDEAMQKHLFVGPKFSPYTFSAPTSISEVVETRGLDAVGDETLAGVGSPEAAIGVQSGYFDC